MVAHSVEVPVARRRVRPLTVLLLFAAVVAVLAVAGVGGGYLISEQKVRAEVARIRAAGEPVTPEVLGLQSFDDPELLGDEAPGDLIWKLFRPADRAVYLQAMRELIAASAAPDYLSLRAAVDRAQRDIAVVVSAPSAHWRCPMSKLLVVSLDSMAAALGRGTARREMARITIAVEKFRRMHGHLPGALEELTPDFLPQVPMDPFSGGPLHWMATGDRYRVYSVGANGINEGGTVEERGDQGDIYFHWRQR